ncbi:MAG: helix-turn-helix protein [Paenibacillaceae bacterium]|nr:helix-turn-helix protein [Paenibacillaceae bacterium]
MRRFYFSKAAWSGPFFRKTLSHILIIAGIPGLLLGGGIYFVVTGQIERELLNQYKRQIEQHADNLDEQLSYLEVSMSHWAFEPLFADYMKSTDYYYSFQATREMNQNLLAKQGSHSVLSSVELYINGVKPLLFNPSHTLTEVKEREQIEYYHTLLHNRGSMYWEGRSLDGSNSLKLAHTIPGGSAKPFGVLIAALDEKKVKEFLKTLTIQEGGTSFLLDREKGMLVSTSDSGDTKELERHLQKLVSEKETDKGAFVYDWKDINYSVSYGKFSRLNSDWIYISASPMTAITLPVVNVSKTILLVSFMGLLFASVSSVVVTRRIYTPIGRLFGLLRGESDHGLQRNDEFQFMEEKWRSLTAESLSLRSKMKDQRLMMKEGFLLQLAQGYLSAFSEQELAERMGFLGWKLNKHHFVVIHIQLTGFVYINGRFTSKDEELVTFAAANIVEELARARFLQAEVINFHDLSIGVLLFIPEDMEHLPEIRSLCAEATEKVSHILHVRLTITIGRQASAIQRIPHLLQEAKEASIYRDFNDLNQLIDLNAVDLAECGNEMKYSFVLEHELIQYLRLGQQEEAEGVLKNFLAELSAGSSKETVIQQGMLQLLGRMMNTMLHCGVNPHTLFKGVNMFERLSQIREADEMLLWMSSQIIHPFLVEMSQRSNDYLKLSVEKAIQFMHDNYMRQDISLDNCAEYAGTNPYTLSKAFKLYIGKNFIDYLTELRMEKAKVLISDTALKICDIAERVGYQNGYFNRIFKRLEGITPRNYRELSRK